MSEKPPMTQDHSSERSAELLRLALPLMSKHGDGFQPVSYAVWYEYVSGGNDALKNDIDATISSGHRLTSDVTFDLYNKHLIDRSEHAVHQARTGLLGVLEKIGDSVAGASVDAGEFNADLRRFHERLADSGSMDTLGGEVGQMLDRTRHMGESLGYLQGEFQRSQDEVQRLAEELSRMRQEVQTDPLTGLSNRRGFDATIHRMHQAVTQGGTTLTLLMLDIDHFKMVNDTYGHLFGDQVIRGVAQAIRSMVKGQDMAARYGGEEFAVLLPDTDSVAGLHVAEQIRSLVERSKIRRFNTAEAVGNITVSIGVTHCRPGETISEFIERADAALYRSKTGGRNRVTGL
jgi:diguanylate cyclase